MKHTLQRPDKLFILSTRYSLLMLLCSLLIPSMFLSCQKLEGNFPIIIRNNTLYTLKELKVECGADPIFFDVGPNALSKEKLLEIGGREVVNEIFVSISLAHYQIDTQKVIYNKGNLEKRNKLKSNSVNYIKARIDSSALPIVNFRFSIEE
ncbi:MAG: hypothetical protein IPK35_00280 [Saprospiraceae bacterium]|jgi:hypothetical protein|nr:hypothetical protein [Saprospiraceae bacterium]